MAENFIGGNPYTDPEANNTADSSVDYYDFDWGEPEEQEQSETESCADRCDSPDLDPTSACGDNTPEQGDEEAYEIIDV